MLRIMRLRRTLARVQIGPCCMSLLFEPRDLWQGIYWTDTFGYDHHYKVYVCLLPTVAVLVEWGNLDRLNF